MTFCLSLCFIVAVFSVAVIILFSTSASTVSAASSTTGSNSKVLPPSLPPHYIADFDEWTAPNSRGPPYVDGKPTSAGAFVSPGKVYYDWTTTPHPSCIEERPHNCINIFPWDNRDFNCTFQNVGGVAYLLTRWKNGKKPHLPGCCVFGSPWHPPRPDFLRRDVSVVVNATNVEWKGHFPTDADTWFEVPSIKPPTGPFQYAFTQLANSSSTQPPTLPFVAIYDTFAFPGMKGWVVQNFVNKTWERPHATTWDLPNECQPVAKLKNCGFFGVDASKYRPFGFKG